TGISEDEDVVAVYFYSDGEVYATYVLNKGEYAKVPITPEDTRTFIGWYDGDMMYLFDTPVNEDLILTAKWAFTTDSLKKLEDKLEEAKKVLEEAIDDGDKALDDKIKALSDRLVTAENELTAVRSEMQETKSSLVTAIFVTCTVFAVADGAILTVVIIRIRKKKF
ncbi:MAG: hypothetical protein ACI4QR_04225, partial [Eubacteriales bacterium]